MQVDSLEISKKGKPIQVNVILVLNKEIVQTGKLVKIAKIKEEWDEDVENPESLIEKMKHIRPKIDIFTFMQRLPESKQKYDYYMEWDNVAAIPITTYDNWFTKQVKKQARNKIKKSQKEVVVVKKVDFNDDFIKGIMEINNESLIRRGRPFSHYGEDYNTVKKENGSFLDRADFIGAYYKDELIGFVKIVYAGRFARTMGIISKIKHREKAPTNALISKAVEICAKKRVPFLVYGRATYGNKKKSTLSDFKRYNSFKKIDLPRYYVPLSVKGNIAIKLKLHHSAIEMLPEKLIKIFLYFRSKYYSIKYKNINTN